MQLSKAKVIILKEVYYIFISDFTASGNCRTTSEERGGCFNRPAHEQTYISLRRSYKVAKARGSILLINF